MKRRVLLQAAAAVTTLHDRARAQALNRVARIGWLASVHFSAYLHRGLVIDGMRELGWVEGSQYVVESLSYEGYMPRIQELAADLVRRRPDVIIASSSATVGPLMKETSSIPIVFIAAGDPLGSGFVTSLARPGGNVTGLGGLGEGLFAKSLELLRQALPSAQRLGFAHNPDFPFHVSAMPQLDDAAARLGVQLRKVPVRTQDDLPALFAELARERVQALGLMGQPWQQPRGALLAGLCLEHRMPALTPFDEVARAGVLMAYGWRISDLARRLPYYLDRVLRGAAPGELPVEQPTRFYLTINLKTARSLGLTLPQSFLLRADEVIS